MWNKMLDYLATYKDSLSILITLIIGVATLITSIVSIHVMMSQNKISQEQTDIQKSQVQPIFSIVVHQQQDMDDGKYGTDVLNVRNIGAKIQDFTVDVNVFFRLSRHDMARNDTIYFEVLDYFNASSVDKTGNELIKSTFGVSNNRLFFYLYQQALDISHKGVIYFLDKVILTKITYIDVLKKGHVVYFDEGREISQQQYQNYFDYAQQTSNAGFALQKLKFAQMKAQIDACSKKSPDEK